MHGDGGSLTRTSSERLTSLLTVAGDLPKRRSAQRGAGPYSHGGVLTRRRRALRFEDVQQRRAHYFERHRAAYLIYDRERAFGSGVSVGRFEQPGRRQDQERVRELVDDARRAITESLTRELDQELPGLDEAIGA